MHNGVAQIPATYGIEFNISYSKIVYMSLEINITTSIHIR